MKIKKLIWLVSILFFVSTVNGLTKGNIYSFIPPARYYLSCNFEINSVAELDTIYQFAKRYTSFYNTFSEDYSDILKTNPFFIDINFNNMNENQIDSAICQINSKKLSYRIISITITNSSIKKIPKSLNFFKNLSTLRFDYCDNISSFTDFNTTARIFAVKFYNCRIKKLPDGIENLKSYIRLSLEFPVDFSGFDLDQELKKFEKRNNIFDMAIVYAKCDKFPETIFNLKALQTLVFISKEIDYYPKRFNELPNLFTLITTGDDDLKHFCENINYCFIIDPKNNFLNTDFENYLNHLYIDIFANPNTIHYIDNIEENRKRKIREEQEDYVSEFKVLADDVADSTKFSFKNSSVILSRGEIEGMLNIEFPDLMQSDSARILLYKKKGMKPYYDIQVIKNYYQLDMRSIQGFVIKIIVNNEAIAKSIVHMINLE